MPGGRTLARSLTLPAEPRSARDARLFVAALLEACGRPEWLEAAELAVSEIVTNAVLHAHTGLTVTASCDEDQLRVDVRDHSPSLPSQRRYDDEATTGRGMSLVAAVTSTHGVTSLGPEGKLVWFTIGDGEDEDLDALLDAWPDDLPDPEPTAQVTKVVLRSMPPTLWLAARQHHDALLRELALLHPNDPELRAALAAADEARWTVSRVLEAAVGELPSSGGAQLDVLPAVDLVLLVPAATAPAFGVLQDVLDRAERLAARDLLLVRPGLPEVIAVRDWACEQVIAQLAGSPGSPWSGTAAEAFIDDVPGVTTSWDPREVLEAGRGVVAADDANRILAVSEPFARELGWDADALVGRRVVALVPNRFREAHVAGFTRHLATGEAHVLGMPLELPVLRGDGTETMCTLLIESSGTSGGRTVYVAWITPVAE